MVISNCLFSPTSENLKGFSGWCVLAKLTVNPRQLIIAKPVSQNYRKLKKKLKKKNWKKHAF